MTTLPYSSTHGFLRTLGYRHNANPLFLFLIVALSVSILSLYNIIQLQKVRGFNNILLVHADGGGAEAP